MSFAKDGNSDIYTMDLENRIVERITDHPSIDTSPSYSPDGKYICFNSDRSGYQQIYVMKSNGKNVKRISFGKVYMEHQFGHQRRFNCFYKTS